MRRGAPAGRCGHRYHPIDRISANGGPRRAAGNGYCGEGRSSQPAGRGEEAYRMAKRIALDTSSRSTAALVRMLCAGYWNISPEFVDAAPDPSEMLKQADAALVIGDPALRISLKMEALAGKVPARRRVLPGRSRRHARARLRHALCLRRGPSVARDDGQALPCSRFGRDGPTRSRRK